MGLPLFTAYLSFLVIALGFHTCNQRIGCSYTLSPLYTETHEITVSISNCDYASWGVWKCHILHISPYKKKKKSSAVLSVSERCYLALVLPTRSEAEACCYCVLLRKSAGVIGVPMVISVNWQATATTISVIWYNWPSVARDSDQTNSNH